MKKETTGDRIRRLRKAKGMTMTALADSAEISKGFMHDLENDRRTMGGSTLLRMSRALGVGMELLLTGSEDKRIAELKDQQRDFPRVCHWKEDDDGIWNTTCKLAWSFEYATTPKENSMNYCPKCGATLLLILRDV